jgi:creatinine amidohydrolase
MNIRALRLCCLFALVLICFPPSYAAGQDNKITDGALLGQVFEDMQEFSVSYLRPDQIIARLDEASVAYIPLGPLEWHGLHMPMGADPMNAQTVSLACCRITGGIVWPALFFGAATLRSPEQAAKIFGPEANSWVNSVDFPGNILPSAFSSPDMLALITRESVRQASAMGAKVIILMSGHAAGSHMKALNDIANEIKAKGNGPLVYVMGAWSSTPLHPEKEGHATALETSIIMAQTRSVDLGQLPPPDQPLKYAESGIADDWSGSGKTGYTVSPDADPRTAASAAVGAAEHENAVSEISGKIKELLKDVR